MVKKLSKFDLSGSCCGIDTYLTILKAQSPQKQRPSNNLLTTKEFDVKDDSVDSVTPAEDLPSYLSDIKPRNSVHKNRDVSPLSVASRHPPYCQFRSQSSHLPKDMRHLRHPGTRIAPLH